MILYYVVLWLYILSIWLAVILVHEYGHYLTAVALKAKPKLLYNKGRVGVSFLARSPLQKLLITWYGWAFGLMALWFFTGGVPWIFFLFVFLYCAGTTKDLLTIVKLIFKGETWREALNISQG